MIFIGADLSDPKAHFVTNIVKSIGTGDDLVVDLRYVKEWEEIATVIRDHCNSKPEQYVIYNAWEDESLPLHFKHSFPELRLITFFSDDEWRHANYDRYLALFSDIFTIAVRGNLERYRGYGLEHVYYMRWGCNQTSFFPIADLDQIYDVTFIGAAYGKRVEYVQHLLRKGINISVFGPGWDRVSEASKHWGGILTHQDMIRVISQSKINLNFLWTSRDDGSTTIKGRTLELAACKAFQLSNVTEEFSNYGFVVGENIAVFNDKNDLLEKIEYYLEHDVERKSIAQKAYEHVLQNLTWDKQFQNVFELLEKNPTLNVQRKYRVMVVVGSGAQHQVSYDDFRLEINIVDLDSDWRNNAKNMDGVVMLLRDSTLNNDTLYMMAFGLVADKFDIIAANFYVGSGAKSVWIRFADRLIESKRALLRKLPVECLMFSGLYAANHGCVLIKHLPRLNVSYIEYPSFSIEMPFIWSRDLRLCFGYHRAFREKVSKYITGLQPVDLLSIGADKLWQMILNKRRMIGK